jgi:hypothetical protein
MNKVVSHCIDPEHLNSHQPKESWNRLRAIFRTENLERKMLTLEGTK